MEQEYYYSSLTGPQIDAALNQISQAAGYASLAAISAEKAGISAEEARRFAAETNGYSKNQSDARFASGILLEESGTAITVTGDDANHITRVLRMKAGEHSPFQ